MNKKGRYSTLGAAEGEFERGSQNRVLKNLQGIKLKREMNVAETIAYDKVTVNAMDLFGERHSFTAIDICKIHKAWLGDIYAWAGAYRSVNMSKNGFQFASAHLVPKLMQELEKKVLNKYTPCSFSSTEEIAEAIAVVHTEFIFILLGREMDRLEG
jgi:cell filamentation protein